jgi:hypothetical protein
LLILPLEEREATKQSRERASLHRGLERAVLHRRAAVTADGGFEATNLEVRV